MNALDKHKKQGWCFTYDSKTRFLCCIHPEGGKFLIAEFARYERAELSEQVGQATAKFLNEKPELLPCPCTPDGSSVFVQQFVYSGVRLFWVNCDSCTNSSPINADRAYTIGLWNARKTSEC